MPVGSGTVAGGRQGSGACISSLPGLTAVIYEQRCTRNLETLDCSNLSAVVREDGYHQERVPTEDLCTPVGFHFFYLYKAGDPSEPSQRWWQLSATIGSFGAPPLPPLGELEGRQSVARKCSGA